jgi:HK97 family phage major capsid protein
MNDFVTAITGVKKAFEDFKQINDTSLAKNTQDTAEVKEAIKRVQDDVFAKIEAVEKAQAKSAAENEVLTKRLRMGGTTGERDSKNAKQFNGYVNGLMTDARVTSGQKSALDAEGYAAYKEGFKSALSKGLDVGMLTPDERKAMSVGIGADGGFAVPQELSNEIVRICREYSPMRQLARTQAINTDKLDIIVQTSGAASGWVGETTARPATNTPQINKISIALNEIYAFPQVTQWALDDPMLDEESFLADEVSIQFAQQEGIGFINGTGGVQPQGLLTLPAGTGFGQIEQINNGAATFTSGAAQIDGLMQLVFGNAAGTSPAFSCYLPNSKFLMNRATLQQIMKLKSTQNQYLFDIVNDRKLEGQTPMFYVLGFPTLLDPNMPVAAANALAVAFGDFQQAYRIVEKNGTRMLRDPYTNKPYIGYYTTRRVGGGVVDARAVRLLKMV